VHSPRKYTSSVHRQNRWDPERRTAETSGVIPRPIEVEPGTIVFTAGKLIRVTIASCDRGCSEGLIRVASPDRASRTDQPYRRTQRVSQEADGPARVSTREVFVDAQPWEQIGCRARGRDPIQFLHWIKAVVEELRCRTVDRGPLPVPAGRRADRTRHLASAPQLLMSAAQDHKIVT
jgi:hypothetical protein